MPIRVKKSKITKNSISSELDFLSDVQAPKEVKENIKNEVGNYLLEQTLLHVGEANSPVDGENFPKLSNNYRKFKEESRRPGIANLEFSGDMLDAVSVKPTGQGIEIGIFNNSKEASKADGHNNFSGSSELPKRRFLPQEGQGYKNSIEAEVNKIINDAIAGSETIPRSKLAEIQTKADMWRYLGLIFPNFSRAEIKGSIKRSSELSKLFIEFNLLRFLE